MGLERTLYRENALAGRDGRSPLEPENILVKFAYGTEVENEVLASQRESTEMQPRDSVPPNSSAAFRSSPPKVEGLPEYGASPVKEDLGVSLLASFI